MGDQPPPDETGDFSRSDKPLLDAGFTVSSPANGEPAPAGQDRMTPTVDVRPQDVSPLNPCEPVTEAATPLDRPGEPEAAAPPIDTARLQWAGEIARGGMGVVLKARDVELGRDIAVKVLLEVHAGKSEFARRFVEEARIAGQLQHPGVAPVYELGVLPDHRPYFTMKLVKGQTLAVLLAARPQPAAELPRFLGIFEQVCQTLAYAHARGVIHRDLKPLNVMVGAFGEVQVMDWGLAKVLSECDQPSRERKRAENVSVIRTARSQESDTPEGDSYTQAGTLLGTPAYLAPEQARGDVDLVDERADVFGLGAILCEILTGEPPFLGKGAEATRKAQTAQLEDAYTRLDGSGVDAELIALAKRCLAAEPWDRPQQAGEVAAAVTAYEHAVTERLRQAELARAVEEARAVEARVTAAQERKARRMTLALAAAVLLLVLLGGGGWLWLRSEREARLAETNRAVYDALNQATKLRERASTAGGRAALDLAAQARVQLQRAETLVASVGGDAALADQVREQLAELDADERNWQQLLASSREDLFRRGTALLNNHRLDEAVAEYHKALQLDPAFTNALFYLGLALARQDKLDEAVAAYRKALQLDPNDDMVHYHFGIALAKQDKLDEAIAEYLKTLAIKPKYDSVHGWWEAVAQTFARQGRLEEFRAAWQKTLKGNPPDHRAWFGYAELCLFLGREDEYRSARTALLARFGDTTQPNIAERTCRACLLLPARGDELRRAAALADRAAAASPKHPFYPYFEAAKGLAEYRRGRLEQAIHLLRESDSLVPHLTPRLVLAMAHYRCGRQQEGRQTLAATIVGHDWDEAGTANVNGWIHHVLRREAEELIVPNLSAFLKGQYQPRDNKERLDLIDPCRFRKRYRAAARLFSAAFADEPRLADNMKAQHRYNAACCAAMASAGQGEKAPELDDKERSRWLKQAVDWLRADLTAYGKLLDSDKPEDRTVVPQRLQSWPRDGYLAGIRDKNAVEKLPAEARAACNKLWTEFEALSKKAQQGQK